MLSLDVGTSSVRALLYDRRARVVPGEEAHLPYQPRIAADGTAEVDSERLISLTRRAVAQVLAGTGAKSGRPIAAVGVSTFWHGLLAADPEGKPLTPLYLWSDTRSADAAEELRGRVDGEAVRQRTGCPIHSSYWPAKLLWLRGHRPDLWRRQVRWLSFGDLLLWRLFGKPLTSLSMASGTGLMRLDDRAWDGELMKLLDIEPESLPHIGEAVAGLLPSQSRRWPGLKEVPWLCAAGDGALANLGSGCLDPSRRALTVGTSGALRVMHDHRPGPLPQGLWRYRLDGRRFVTGGALSNGGNLHAWLAHTLEVDETGLERRLARMPPAGHGLVFLPHLNGQRSLGYAPHAFGAISGLRSVTTALDIVRAGLEAVALDFAAVDQRLDDTLPGATRLVGSGAGLLASPAWMRIMASAIGRPLVAGKAREASSRGAALLALEHLGWATPGIYDAGAGPAFQPDPEATRIYRQAQARQEELYRLLITGPVS